MIKKKVFLLIPSGVALRNFAFTDFYDLAKSRNLNIVFWNATPFELSNLGFEEVKLKNIKIHWFTDILKNVRKEVELNLNIKNNKDDVYHAYKFKRKNNSFKAFLKNSITGVLAYFLKSNKGLSYIKNKINKLEKSTDYYKHCLETLVKEKPDFVFCANQRIINAVAPLLAAKELNIPTSTFIFSWDNLPKATLVVDSDYYFVWSLFMKQEMKKYYPLINQNTIISTGTPQFESHFNKNILVSKQEFYKTYGLDFSKDYICFSGDDITTSPDDPKYLRDLANAIKALNNKGLSLGIILRKCPVDFSNRFDGVIHEFKDIITEIAPKWNTMNNSWNTILPTKADTILLSNTIKHSLFVVNIGSSMVFDYAALNKPCCYFRYNQKTQENPLWDINKIYNYVHFRSMPDKAVVYFDSSFDIEAKIKEVLDNNAHTVKQANIWFDVICQSPQNQSSNRIIEAIETIISKR